MPNQMDFVDELSILISIVRNKIDSLRYSAPEMMELHINEILEACNDAESKINEGG